MDDAMNTGAPAGIGHNQPPEEIDEQTPAAPEVEAPAPDADPVATALRPWDSTIMEAENWLDGSKVESDDQEAIVGALKAKVLEAEKSIGAARDAEVKPLDEAVKAARARWKPTLDDLARIKKGLVALGADWKEQKRRRAREAEEKARREAEEKQRAAIAAQQAARERAGDIEAAREADRLEEEAKAARKAAVAAGRETKAVKGLRKVHRHEVTDYRAALMWIATNDPDEMRGFIEDYARRNSRQKPIDGVRTWEAEEAF